MKDAIHVVGGVRTPFCKAGTDLANKSAADLGVAELIRSGTTTLLDMGSVEHTDQIGEAVVDGGMRAHIGKAMMDRGDDVPRGLRENTRRSLLESEALHSRWHHASAHILPYDWTARDFQFSKPWGTI